jgi:putative membrane protein
MKRAFTAIGIATFAASASAQSAPSTADFVKAVAISDMFEIESSKLALEKKVAADQAFAKRMVHDHSQTTEQLKRLVGGGKVKAQLPPELDGGPSVTKSRVSFLFARPERTGTRPCRPRSGDSAL